MRTVDPRKHELRRSQILAAAVACFSRKGFHGTSTNDVCTAAGMSPGNLFHYFPNKKALILAVVTQQGEQVQALLQDLGAEADPRRALDTLFDVLFEVAADADGRRLVLEIAAEAARDADVQALCQRDDAVLREGMLQLLGAARPHPAPAAPPLPQAVEFLMCLVDGIFSRPASDPAFNAAQVRATLAWVLDGLSAASTSR